MGEGQVQAAAAGQAPGLLQHQCTVAGADAGVDDQRGLLPEDDADVGDQLDAVVLDDENTLGHFDGRSRHDGRGAVQDIRRAVGSERRGVGDAHDTTPNLNIVEISVRQ